MTGEIPKAHPCISNKTVLEAYVIVGYLGTSSETTALQDRAPVQCQLRLIDQVLQHLDVPDTACSRHHSARKHARENRVRLPANHCSALTMAAGPRPTNTSPTPHNYVPLLHSQAILRYRNSTKYWAAVNIVPGPTTPIFNPS